MQLLVLSAAAMIAQAAVTPTMLAPHGAWSVGDTPGMCLVARSYDSNDGQIALGLRMRADGRYADLSLAGVDGATHSEDWNGSVGLTMLPSGRHFDTMAQGALLTNGTYSIRITMSEETAALLDQSTGLTIDSSHSSPRAFALDQQLEAEVLLHRCHAALLRSWGVDSTRLIPIGKIKAAYMSPSTYPAAAVAARQQGRVSALIEVAPDGHVSHCRVVESSQSDSLDEATCDIATNKARFTPVPDGAGKPTTFWSVLSMRWGIAVHATPDSQRPCHR